MTIRAMVTPLLFGALSMAVSYPGLAQNAVGGAIKTKQNTVGGVAKPAPVIGGAATSASVGTKPATVGAVPKPGTVTSAPGSIGNAANAAGRAAKQNPPVTPPGKGGTVVTTSSNLKCAAGACVAKGTKP